MPRISEKRRLENEIASTMEAVALAMLLESVAFLHPSDKPLDFFSLPRSHRVGSRKQARWWRAGRRGDVVIVLSGGGDVVVKGVVAVTTGRGKVRYVKFVSSQRIC